MQSGVGHGDAIRQLRCGCRIDRDIALSQRYCIYRAFLAKAAAQKMRYGFRITPDQHQVSPQTTKWSRSALFPIPNLIDREAELRGEIVLGQTELLANLSNAYFRRNAEPGGLRVAARNIFKASLRPVAILSKASCSFDFRLRFAVCPMSPSRPNTHPEIKPHRRRPATEGRSRAAPWRLHFWAMVPILRAVSPCRGF